MRARKVILTSKAILFAIAIGAAVPAGALALRHESQDPPDQDQDVDQAHGAGTEGSRPKTGDEDSPPEPLIAPSQALGYSGPFLLRDGAALAGAAGRLVRSRHGFWEFVVVPDDRSREPASFIVLPSHTLSRMERAVEASTTDDGFEVTGTVYVFDGENYLLPLSAPRIDPDQPGSAETVQQPEPSESSPPGQRDTSQLTAEEIIRGVERDVPAARSLVVDEPSDPLVDSLEDVASDGFDDGAIMMSRRGRITRTAEGGWRFNFAADAAGLSDPPMTLLPCLLLESIRNRIEVDGDDQVFLMTGQVFSYHGRRFMLPTMFRMEDVERNPNIRR